MKKSAKWVLVDRFFKGRPTSAVFVANMSYSLVTWLLSNGRIWIMKREEAS